MRIWLPGPKEFPLQHTGKTRKARKDAMPHERGSTPVLPSEFSSIALADRQTRIRRELPAALATINGHPA